MKSLTIHNLDADLARAIEKMAATTGLSQNKVIKMLLKKALGLKKPDKPQRDLSEFFGSWTKEEAAAIEEAIKEFDKIDEVDWT